VGRPVAVPRTASRGPLRDADPALSVLLALSILMGFALLGLLLYAAQFSGSARWIAGVLFVGLLSLLATYAVLRRTVRPAPLQPPTGPGDILDGELAILSGIVERAGRGLAFSQSLVVGRARDAFAERVRILRGLPAEAMRALEADPARLRALLGDEPLAEFLIGTRERADREAWAASTRAGDGFVPSIHAVLARMEAWR